jgi:tight adherence protein C
MAVTEGQMVAAAACFGVAAALATVSLRPAVGGLTRRVTAKATEERSRAGRARSSRHDALGPAAATPEAVAALLRRQVVTTAVAGALIGILVAASPQPGSIAAGAMVVVAAWRLPLIGARRRERDRLLAVDRELSDALGEIIMGVEAGMTLEAVVLQYSERHRTPLSREFGHFGGLVRAGTTRKSAIQALNVRNPSPIVRAFVGAVEQNLVLGSPLGTVLRKQAETIRRHRRQAAETRAAGVSMKMIFPTVFCILPVLMVVVVGPAIVRLLEVL